MTSQIYIHMFSVHGLLRFHNMELGRDADTGGQIKYVVELAYELSKRVDVGGVDLFTRLISDKQVSEDYGVPIEAVNDKFRIVRIQCGGKKYFRKELVWPHLDEYIDKTIKFIKREGRHPHVIHAHYADAGYIGIHLSEYFEIPFIFTGHSLGRSKKDKLSHQGMSSDEMNRNLKIDHRIEIEEETIKHADLVVTSTSQEIEKQYGLYRNRSLSKYVVIPPGIDLDKFYPYYHDMVPDTIHKREESIRAHASILEELNRFFLNTEKPLVLALCRADRRKNISGLIEAFASDKELKAIANLAIFAGIRKNIEEMEENEKAVLTQMLLLMDKYDLYGKMAIPKRHDFTYEVPELYRIAAHKRGVFVNVAFTEPFGLSLIEASASGLPIVATNDGGPRDIVRNCKNGILVDPSSPLEVAGAIKSLIVDEAKWESFSRSGIEGVNRHYNWNAHVAAYLSEVQPLSESKIQVRETQSSDISSVGDRITRLQYFVITDIDNTLTGDDAALEEFVELMRQYTDQIGFGVATGRTVDSALQVLTECGTAIPDIVISSVGAEMYYRGKKFPDRGWQTHISKHWQREKVKTILDKLDYLTYQEKDTQREYKISYYLEPAKDRLAEIHNLLTKNKCHYNLIYSHDRYLDILPHRASKGKAIQYLIYKWEINPGGIVVCGDSGNDEEMLRANTLGVVVANHTSELEPLRSIRKNIYFSDKSHARGIIDGMFRYRIIERAKAASGKKSSRHAHK